LGENVHLGAIFIFTSMTLAKSVPSTMFVKTIMIDIDQTLVLSSAIMAYLKDLMTHPDKPTFQCQREELLTISCAALFFNKTNVCKFLFVSFNALSNKTYKSVSISLDLFCQCMGS
jgi:hypothetical protein